MGVTAITCTGDRQDAFDLAEQYVSRQTLKMDRWIVVDDGREATQVSCNQEVLRLPPMATQSLDRNLLAALNVLTPKDEMIVIIEDDDYYAPEYFQKYVKLLRDFPLVGEGANIYFHVKTRYVHDNHNTKHASLCATVFRYEVVDTLKQICVHGNNCVGGSFIDIKLWCQSEYAGLGYLSFDRPPLCVGIKGLPGRQGIGRGHQTDWISQRGIADPDLRILASLIGKDDAERYRVYGEFR